MLMPVCMSTECANGICPQHVCLADLHVFHPLFNVRST